MMSLSVSRLLMSACAFAVIGCVTTPSLSAGDVLAESLSLTSCPARADEAGVKIFNEADWVEHLAQAGERAESLSDWQPNFANQRIALVMMGERRTLGYSITVKPPVMKTDSNIQINVKRSTPATGAIVPMALSSPCTYVLLNSVDFDALAVSDADSGLVVHRWAR